MNQIVLPLVHVDNNITVDGAVGLCLGGVPVFVCVFMREGEKSLLYGCVNRRF